MAAGDDLTINTHRYCSTIFLCLLFSFLLSLSFLPPLTQRAGGEKYHGIVSHAGLSSANIVMFCILVWFACNKKNYHRRQTVFWPRQCRHCAKALGLLDVESDSNAASSSLPSSSSSAETSLHNTLMTGATVGSGTAQGQAASSRRNSQPRSLDSMSPRLTLRSSSERSKSPEEDCNTSSFSQRRRLSKPSSSSLNQENARPFSPTSELSSIDFHNQQLTSCGSINVSPQDGPEEGPTIQTEYRTFPDSGLNKSQLSRRHQSLAIAFYVFSVIAIIGVPIRLAGSVECLMMKSQNVGLIFEEILDISFLILLPAGTACIALYHDAIFVDTALNCYASAFLLGGNIWLATFRVLLPVGELLGNNFVVAWTACNLNGTFGNFLRSTNSSMTHFYVECGIIGAAIMWTIWTSIVPSHLVRFDQGCPEFQSFITSGSPKSLSIKKSLRGIFTGWFMKSDADPDEHTRLLSRDQRDMDPLLPVVLKRTYILSFVAGLAYFICSYVLLRESSEKEGGRGSAGEQRNESLVYIQWCCTMLFYLPVVVVCLHQQRLTRDCDSVITPSGSSTLSSFLGGDDIVLLISLFGVFALAIFRLISAIGILFRSSNLAENVALASFAIFFSLYEMVRAWLMTSFLLLVQRQVITGPAQVRWTLVLLVYTGMASAVDWVADSLEKDTWPVERLFFREKVGLVIGILLRPMAMLNELYAAVVSYHAFKTIRSTP
ncbi:uncharacterized protein [Diadema antillarum]|uniref:uncharacterized protein n=1 Tax=Diadema antillarum TaxID=105358 RepID=UPI003A8B3943